MVNDKNVKPREPKKVSITIKKKHVLSQLRSENVH